MLALVIIQSLMKYEREKSMGHLIDQGASPSRSPSFPANVPNEKKSRNQVDPDGPRRRARPLESRQCPASSAAAAAAAHSGQPSRLAGKAPRPSQVHGSLSAHGRAPVG